VWSGACKYANRIAFDFKMSEFYDDEGMALSGIAQHVNFPKPEKNVGSGFFLGQDYNIKESFKIRDDWHGMDLHEFNVIDGGRRVLIVTENVVPYSAKSLGFNEQWWVAKNGFKEIDVKTGETLHEWDTKGHVGLDESTYIPDNAIALGGPGASWDAL
jgi:hypothetical protein